jgi:hypothetical protein
MVASAFHICPVVELLWAAQPAEPVLERLDPPKRTFVIMAIIFIAIVGLLLVTCTMLGARWVRGISRQQPRPPRLDNGALAAAENRNLRASLDGMLPNVDPNETIHTDREKGETKVDP